MIPNSPGRGEPERTRLRSLGIRPGVLPTGRLNALTDVSGVRVGHFTLIQGNDIRTGATAILPHEGSLYRDRVPAGIAVANGFGKLMGYTQVRELGELEAPILLTNTLAVPRAAEAIIDWTLRQPGNENIVSVNAVVGETNDGRLNDIRRRALTVEMCLEAIEGAQAGPVEEGCVGAGVGTICFDWKGGIGTSSRRLPESLGGFTVGALVQTNFGGVLQVAGLPVGRKLERYYLRQFIGPADANGSCMIVLATDASLSDRNLTRLARRGLFGMGRTGAAFSDGSGDYAIAFSTAATARRRPDRRSPRLEMTNERMSPLFLAAIEAVEEAIYNSLTMATTMRGYNFATIQALPLGPLVELARAGRSAL